MAANLKEKRTSITMVPSIFPSFATFPTHLLFHYPLPLNRINFFISDHSCFLALDGLHQEDIALALTTP
jgi:hypothetical protein